MRRFVVVMLGYISISYWPAVSELLLENLLRSFDLTQLTKISVLPDDPFQESYRNFVPSPKLAKHTRLGFLKLADVEQDKFDFLNYFRKLLNGAELLLRYERNFGVSFCLILDTKDVTANHHLSRIRPLLTRDFIYFAMQTVPFRYSNFYIINAPQPVAVTLNNLVVPFLSKKMKSRFHITANGFEEISQYFDKSTLPRDYGGDQPSMKELSDYWRDKEIQHRDWFVNELSEKCDESKRITIEDPTNPYFGVPGSLKKLVVD